MATPSADELVRERRARRAAARGGWVLWKCRRRSTRGAVDVWSVSDVTTQRMVAGTISRGGLTIDDVERWLAEPRGPRMVPERDAGAVRDF